jgi:hypothetical protein
MIDHPNPDGRLKDPVKVSEDRARKRQAWIDDAAVLPVAAYVTGAYILAADGEVVVAAGSVTPTRDVLVTLGSSPLRGSGPSFYGFGLPAKLRVLAMEGLHRSLAVPEILWERHPYEIAISADPYKTLIASAEEKDVSLQDVCEYLGLTYPADLLQNVVSQASLAYQLAKAAQLI